METSLLLKLPSSGLADSSTSRLRQEFQVNRSLFQAQTGSVQQYLKDQAVSLAGAVLQGSSQVHFTLPAVVAHFSTPDGRMDDETVPTKSRDHVVGGWVDRWVRTDLWIKLSRYLRELELSPDQAISLSAGLVRFAVATHLVNDLLPAGKSVIYKNTDNDDIPHQPIELDGDHDLVFQPSLETQAILGQSENNPERLVAPYVGYARRFYLPQWVAFDDFGHLLPSSLSEAENYIASMQTYIATLNSAVRIAPYMIADETWQQKRYGMLGQLVNQGRAFAHYKQGEIIQTIKRRVAENRMDRGLSVNLPYFDDQKLMVEKYEFTVIPTGWVMFIPAFAVLAAREQQIKVAGNTRLSYSTRRHLLAALQDFELEFIR